MKKICKNCKYLQLQYDLEGDCANLEVKNIIRKFEHPCMELPLIKNVNNFGCIHFEPSEETKD